MIWFPPGSSTIWIFGKDVDVINETGGKLGKLQRRGAHSNYVRGAAQIPDVRGQPQYEDGSHHTCCAENFMFGVATSSSKHFEERHIDGILGLGVVKGHPVSGIEPDLFVNRLHAEYRIEVTHTKISLLVC
ncbi:hypothetical protein B0H10DRAFT_1942734 [Mycena sp. CBHHK59/15]|nr:hypothetical protein B0H10DRAFT_1942734 [Mycena sp. CBHHK59/15]